jgi:hypothetical protein
MHKLLIACLAVFGVASLAHADEWNKKTELTVKETIEVPGATLQPGKYVIKLLESPANRHIVQIMNEEENQVITTVLAIPNERLRPTGDSTFSFYESPAGQAPALRAWFYPGDTFGQEFAYPKRRAQELAAATGQKVPTLDENDLKRPEPTQTAQARPAPEPAPARTEPRPAPAPPRAAEPEPQVIAQAQPQERPRPTPAQPAPEPELPATAGPAPLFGLLGLLSLGGAFGLRALSKRAAR